MVPYRSERALTLPYLCVKEFVYALPRACVRASVHARVSLAPAPPPTYTHTNRHTHTLSLCLSLSLSHTHGANLSDTLCKEASDALAMDLGEPTAAISSTCGDSLGNHCTQIPCFSALPVECNAV